MRLPIVLTGALALTLAACAQTATEDAGEVAMAPSLSTEDIYAAVANEARPERARELDDSRKPAEVLAFFGLEQGDDAVDLISGGGYWAEILARAVGDSGSVTAFEPDQFYSEEAWTALSQREPGIALERYRFEALQPGSERFDIAIMNLVYHDLYWESDEYDVPRSDPADFLAALHSMMRPGGIVGVIDHVGKDGDTRAIVQDYHRIDPQVIRDDFEKAGFVLEAESDLLSNSDDTHEISVFDPSIRGKTDRVVMKFVKPAE
jgi:predicted methyltransferase